MPEMFKAFVLMIALASAGCAGHRLAQHARPILTSDLTVPKDRLSRGCALSPTASARIDGNRVQGGLWAGLPIPTNPWSGTDRQIIASIRERVDGPLLVADAPPPTARELSRNSLLLADGVGEAYAAISSMGDGRRPGVPRRRLTNACCSEVKRRRASESVSAAMTLMAAIRHGRGNWGDGLNWLRYR